MRRPTAYRGRTLASALVMLSLITSSAFASDHVPLPSNVKVEAPDPSVPTEVGRFSGRWEGLWAGAVPHILVVRRIERADSKGRHKVDVVFAWGDYPGGGIRAGYREADGTIAKDELVVEMRRETVWYKLADTGQSLEGRWQGRAASYYGVFSRLAP